MWHFTNSCDTARQRCLNMYWGGHLKIIAMHCRAAPKIWLMMENCKIYPINTPQPTQKIYNLCNPCSGLFCACEEDFLSAFFQWKSACMFQFHSLRPEITPQWLSKLRWPWMSVPWWAVWELISLMGSHTMPRHHSQPTLTSLGQTLHL